MPWLFSFLITLTLIGTASDSAETIPPSEFEVAEGFEIQVWATTPQRHNPTNFDVDSKGRMWVGEKA